jgi:putative membrane protein
VYDARRDIISTPHEPAINATIVSDNGAPATVLSAAPTRTSLSGTRRPARALLFYYILRAFSTRPGFVVMLPLLFFRYHTLRYDLDAEGITVRWGVLFRREVTLTYARIQDINLVSNLIERWLGLGRVQIQTASGQSDAEVTIEGLHDFEVVRDELYRRMRGARDLLGDTAATTAATRPTPLHEVAAALREATAELRALRNALERAHDEKLARSPAHAEQLIVKAPWPVSARMQQARTCSCAWTSSSAGTSSRTAA